MCFKPQLYVMIMLVLKATIGIMFSQYYLFGSARTYFISSKLIPASVATSR